MAIYRPERQPKRWEKPDLGHPLCQGIVGWWMLNDRGGPYARDISGKGNHGALVSTPTWSGNYLLMDGTDRVNIQTPPIKAYPFTITMWVSPMTPGVYNCSYIESDVSEVDQSVILALLNSGGNFLLRGAIYNVAYDSVDGNTLIEVKQWVNIAFVCASSTDRRIYLNGRLENTDISSIDFPAGVDTTNLGLLDRSSTDVYYPGWYSEVRTYNRAFSAVEIYQLYENSLSGRYEEFPKLMTTFFYPAAGPVVSVPLIMLEHNHFDGGSIL